MYPVTRGVLAIPFCSRHEAPDTPPSAGASPHPEDSPGRPATPRQRRPLRMTAPGIRPPPPDTRPPARPPPTANTPATPTAGTHRPHPAHRHHLHPGAPRTTQRVHPNDHTHHDHQAVTIRDEHATDNDHNDHVDAPIRHAATHRSRQSPRHPRAKQQRDEPTTNRVQSHTNQQRSAKQTEDQKR